MYVVPFWLLGENFYTWWEKAFLTGNCVCKKVLSMMMSGKNAVWLFVTILSLMRRELEEKRSKNVATKANVMLQHMLQRSNIKKGATWQHYNVVTLWRCKGNVVVVTFCCNVATIGVVTWWRHSCNSRKIFTTFLIE